MRPKAPVISLGTTDRKRDPRRCVIVRSDREAAEYRAGGNAAGFVVSTDLEATRRLTGSVVIRPVTTVSTGGESLTVITISGTLGVRAFTFEETVRIVQIAAGFRQVWPDWECLRRAVLVANVSGSVKHEIRWRRPLAVYLKMLRDVVAGGVEAGIVDESIEQTLDQWETVDLVERVLRDSEMRGFGRDGQWVGKISISRARSLAGRYPNGWVVFSSPIPEQVRTVAEAWKREVRLVGEKGVTAARLGVEVHEVFGCVIIRQVDVLDVGSGPKLGTLTRGDTTVDGQLRIVDSVTARQMLEWCVENPNDAAAVVARIREAETKEKS